MNYFIGQGRSVGEMIAEARRLIGMGWVPLGGISVCIGDFNVETYSQAFTYTEPQEIKE